jgi:PAS domain S-box-containing protein
MTFRLTRDDRIIALKIVAMYSLFGGLWIYLSDSILGILVHNPEMMTRIATFKGFLFIATTAALLYYLIGRYIYRLNESSRHIAASEEDLRSLLELMPVGVAWADQSGAIKYVNHTFIDKLGYTITDVPTVDEWFAKAYPDPAYRQEVVAVWGGHISDCSATGSPVPPINVKITCKDETVRHVVINTQISLTRTLVIFTDITEHESQQEELIRKQKLESIGVLAGGIAHDFNNILTAILGNISFASMFIRPDHKSSAPLFQAEKAAKRAAELAHQLLTFSKGGQPITSSVAPQPLIEESVALVLHGSNAQSRIEVSEKLHNIEADAGQISQVFNNLIINAIQAMPGGGTITIRAANTTVEDSNPFELRPGEYVTFTFTDQGCGIPAINLANIFDPYFTTKSGGSGLGLASVQSIVRKHGGQITVRSTVGKGTTFELLLPASIEPAAVIPPQAAETGMNNGGSHKTSILVMDDEQMILDLAKAILEELSYNVTTCVNGEEAVALYKTALESGTPYSVVIMDLTIPGGMGGKETAEQILAIDPHACLIVSSGYSNDPIVSDYRRFGFASAVIKPYGVAEISGVLNRLPGTQQ